MTLPRPETDHERDSRFHAEQLEQVRLGAAENPMRLTSRIDKAVTKLDAARGERSASLRLVGLDDFVVKPKISWAVRDLIPVGALVVVFGAPKSGKTFAVCDLVMHAAHGMHWHGHTVPFPLRVAFLAGEGRNGLRVRLKAWQAEHATELKGDFRLLPEAVALPERAGEVLAALRDYLPHVVVVDTLNAYFGAGDENSTADMTKFVAALRYILDEINCCIVVIHHTGLADATRARGSGVLRGAADVVVQVAKDENGSGLVAFQVVEGRDIEAWPEPLALKLRRVETDWTDDEGIALTSCVVESGNQPVSLPGRGAKPLGDKQVELLAIAQELARAKASSSPDALIARSDILAEATSRGIAKSTVSMAWESMERRGYWHRVEPGSIRIRVQR